MALFGGDSIFNDFDAKLIPTYGILFSGIAGIIFILYTMSKDPKAVTTNTYVYIFAMAIPLLFVLYYGIPIFSGESSSAKNLGMVVLSLSIFLAGIYFYLHMDKTYFEITEYVSGGLFILIVLLALAMAFYVLGNYFKSFTGWSGFIVYFIFYIPCLIIDFFKYILKEFQATSQFIYVLFFVELLLILLYIYIPQIINSIDKKDSIVLLENGAFLDQSIVIGSSKTLRIPYNKLENKTEEIVYNKNYAFSMWINLNINSNNYAAYTKETNIFDCGNGKPKIAYFNDINDDNKKNKYIVYFTDVKKGPNTYEFSLPNQKWNNFVFNYDYNKVDLFINGELVRTFKFDNNRPKYKATDNITIGSDNGLDGAICNLRYYPKNLSAAHIISNYNLLMLKNPPVFIL